MFAANKMRGGLQGLFSSAKLMQEADLTINDICDNGSDLFVAVGEYNSSETDPEIWTSSDGITWTRRSNPGGVSLYSVAFGASIFVAVGNDAGANGLILSSPDGITWTARTAGDAIFDRVIWEPNSALFYAVGRDQTSSEAMLATSANGTSWTKRSIPDTNAFSRGRDVYYSSGSSPVICVGTLTSVGDTSKYIASADGTSWTVGPTSIGSDDTFLAGKFDSVNSRHWVMTNNDVAYYGDSSGLPNGGDYNVIFDDVIPFLNTRSRILQPTDGGLVAFAADDSFWWTEDASTVNSVSIPNMLLAQGCHYGFDSRWYVCGLKNSGTIGMIVRMS